VIAASGAPEDGAPDGLFQAVLYCIFEIPYIHASFAQRRVFMSDFRSPVDVFKALADDTRSRVALLVAREGELCVCELTAALDLSQPKISRHLAQLRSNGLLTDRRQGQWVYYRLNSQLAPWVATMLQEALTANADWLAADVARLQAMTDRPVRCC
jgi:ArsR family transcriptional regulator